MAPNKKTENIEEVEKLTREKLRLQQALKDLVSDNLLNAWFYLCYFATFSLSRAEKLNVLGDHVIETRTLSTRLQQPLT